ncbi:MAG: hypothetical protein WAN96_02850, partial [Paludibacteraceae bacterium]
MCSEIRHCAKRQNVTSKSKKNDTADNLLLKDRKKKNEKKTANAQLTLNAIADLQDAATLNVNILSHLEKPRITYLMSLGNDFASAKTQAQ